MDKLYVTLCSEKGQEAIMSFPYDAPMAAVESFIAAQSYAGVTDAVAVANLPATATNPAGNVDRVLKMRFALGRESHVFSLPSPLPIGELSKNGLVLTAVEKADMLAAYKTVNSLSGNWRLSYSRFLQHK